MLKLLLSCSLTEKIAVGVLTLVILVSTFQIGDHFYNDNSDPIPGTGGSYVEGVVGEVRFLNPILAQTDLDRDIVSLVACGLTRFDPVSNSIVDYVSHHELSADKRTYTFKIREDATWQDGEPVTADDVIFTYRDVIQDPDFPNLALASDFADVLVTKLDDYTVTMTLKKSYAFFIYNTTTGLLPRHLLADTPVAQFPALGYNLRPVGCGPYKVESVTGSQIKLTAYAGFFGGQPLIDNVIFRIFGSEDKLFQNLASVSGTADLAAKHAKSMEKDSRLGVYEFTLPQYVALFFNTEHSYLTDRRTRLGLQLAIDKNKVVETADRPARIIDTPLLEIDTSDWKYEFSAERADGALYDAGWRYRELAGNTATEAAPAAPAATDTSSLAAAAYITLPSSEAAYATDASEFFLEGTVPAGTQWVAINGYRLQKFSADSTTWSYKASNAIGTLKNGANTYTLTTEAGELDTIQIFYSSDTTERENWLAEASKANEAVELAAETTAPAEVKKSNVFEKSLRYNSDGKALSLKLLVATDHPEYLAVAQELERQWRERGIKIVIEALPTTEVIQRINNRDYELLLFGQNLGYNLDTYPFWHSSEARTGGSNLSNLKSSAVNAWLEQARASFNSSERLKRLADLRETLGSEVPAIFLYTPVYHFAIDKKIKNFNLGRIALTHDRLAGLPTWYLREERALKPEVGFFTFFVWFWHNL